MKNFSKALHYYSRTLDFNSNDPEVYNAIALLYHDFEDYVEARAYYEKSLSIEPNNLTALVDLGNVCYKLFDYKQALEYYYKVLNWHLTIKLLPYALQILFLY